MARKKRYTNKQFELAIPDSGGLFSVIAERVGCSWGTAQTRIMKSPTLRAMLEDETESINDEAFSVLVREIRTRGPKAVEVAKWLLARRRRDEFSERTEISGPDGAQIVTMIEIVKDYGNDSE